MVKFGEHLLGHLTPEWMSQYIEYEELKELLYTLIKNSPEIDENDESSFKAYIATIDEDAFLKRCQIELDKINRFFSKEFEEAQQKFLSLKEDLLEEENVFKINEGDLKIKNQVILNARKSEKLRKKHKESLRLAFSEFYLSLILVQNYQSLNFIGFRKILKKHDKIFKTTSGCEWRQQNVEPATFNTNKRVDDLIIETENLVVEYLEDGNRRRALERLKVPPLESMQNPSVTFRLRLFSTIVTILSLIIIFLVAFLKKENNLSFDWKIALKLYRGSLLIIIHVVFIGINTYIWRRKGINHVLIFEIDPRNYLFHEDIIEIASFIGIFWLSSVILYIISAYLDIEYSIYPIIFGILLVSYILNPFDVMKRSSRFWFIKLLWRSLSAPLNNVTFADFWFADQLCSFDFLFVDLQFITCFYFIQVSWAPFKGENQKPCSPPDYRDLSSFYNVFTLIASCIPSWLRFLQCLRRYRDTRNKFPHLANALKYGSYFLDMIALAIRYEFSRTYKKEWDSPEVYTFVGIHLLTSAYRSWWDLKMDWGFFDKNAGDNKYLREVCIYSSKWYYYFAIVQNVILRFIWIVRIYDISYLNTNKEVYRDVVATILAFLEVYRRFVWNFIRLENEHLNNCGQFRAVRDISIKPLKISERDILSETEDEKDMNDSWKMSRKKINKTKMGVKDWFGLKNKNKNEIPFQNMSLKNLTFVSEK